jgi:TatA/E family protein of Tat protein translocase
MANLGLAQILLIALIVVVIFGATRLPELGRVLGRGLGRAVRERSTHKDASGARQGLTA